MNVAISRPVVLWVAMAGVALGVLVATISRAVSKRLSRAEFWAELPRLVHSLASGSDHAEFVRVYRSLAKLLVSYLANSALRLAASFAPVVAAVVLCGPWVLESYHRGAVGPEKNPLWPYLNDLEFYFYLGIALASALTALYLRKRGR